MRVTDTALDGHVVIAIDGDLDRASIGILDDLVAAHLSNGIYFVILDLADCPFIDSAGLGTIMALLKTVRGKGAVAVTAPSPHIKRLLELVGLCGTEGFEVYETLSTASSAFSCRT